MNFTQNYQLSQWEATDKVQRADFNADNTKIDAVLGSLALEKANQAALAAETAARSSAVSYLTSQLAQKGNGQIVTGSYTGTGEVGKQHPNSLSFSKKPVLVLIGGSNTAIMARGGDSGHILQSGTSQSFNTVWSQNGVSWYCSESGAHPWRQMNESGRRYNYIAFLSI